MNLLKKNCFSFLICFQTAVIGEDGHQARLVIQPDGGNIIRPVGANIVLTCRAEVSDPSLIEDIRWVGIDGRELLNGDR